MRPSLSAPTSIQRFFAAVSPSATRTHLWQRDHVHGFSMPRARKSKRQGQALLLAVLLMVFVALLGSTFITVVALNLNQTARQEDQSSARQAATAGLNLVKQNLTNSPEGEKWRPEMLTPPPAPTDPDYNYYYTAIDRAQGWARNFNHVAGWPNVTPKQEWDWIENQRKASPSNIAYVKFPDPRTNTTTANTPTFLAEVRLLNAATAPDPTKVGTLQISVIGLSENNEAVVERRIAYKGGYAQNPLTAAARSVTNWDFVNNVVPVGQVPAAVSNSPTLPVSNVSGRFPVSGNFYVMIGAPSGAKQGAWVRSVTQAGNAATLTLAQNVTAAAGERVEMAAGLGAPARVDFNNDNTAQAMTEEVALRTSQGTTPGSIWVNGSAFLFGNLFASNLRTPATATTSPAGGIRVSGLIDFREDASNPASQQLAAPQLQNATYSNGSTPTNLPPTALLRSNDPNFPFNAGAVPPSERFALVDDGLNRIQNVPNATARDVKPFTPPSIDNKSKGLDRYRQLTQFSAPANSSDPANASLYGYGEGIYIDNSQDVEKIYNAGSYRPMSSSQLQQLWMNPGGEAIATPYLRLSRPLGQGTAGIPVNASLEEKHVRGWVGPDQFRPRGVLIELDPGNITGGIPDPRVYITRDELSDRAFDPLTPDPKKSWRTASGTGVTLGSYGGVYRQNLKWPANGVIYAEGNVRIRGGAFNANGTTDASKNSGITSLNVTVVSMNNIYIEGSLNAGARKPLLLAKNHVVVNPTAAMSRVDAKTRAISITPSGAQFDLKVDDASLFRKGEWIEKDQSSSPVRQITLDPDTTTNTLRISGGLGTLTPGTTIRASMDPILGGGATGYPYYSHATRLGRFSDAVQRRMFLPGAPGLVRLAMRHNAQRRAAFRVQVEAGTTPPTLQADLFNKLTQVADRQTTLVKSVDKALKIEYAPTFGGDTSPAVYPTPPAPPNNATAAAITLATFGDPMYMKRYMPPGPIQTPLKFTAQNAVLAPYITGNSSPFFFLAAVGNRYDFLEPFSPVNTPVTDPLPKKRGVLSSAVAPDTNLFDIPMGTSVKLAMNGVASTLLSDHFVSAPAPGLFESVGNFGFNPNYGDPATNPAAAFEDALTNDQSFYQGTNNLGTVATNDANLRYTFDARGVTVSSPTTLDTMAIRLNNDEVVPGQTISSFLNPSDNAISPVPYYRLSRMKLEGSGDFSSPANTYNPFNSSNAFERLGAGYEFNIEAFVFAQEGSWVVLPGGFFDENAVDGTGGKLKNFQVANIVIGSYLDDNNDNVPNSGEFLDSNSNGVFDAGDGADLNRDGQITREEQASAFRFRRYNYRINFTGAISEHQTMPVLTEGRGLPTEVRGAVQDWTDKWATTRLNSTSWNGTTAASTINFGNIKSDLATPANSNYDSIRYTFDASALDPAFNDAGFVAPVSPDLIYSG